METELRIENGPKPVSACLVLPKKATALLVFGHGAGAGMRHAFMEDMAGRLASVQIATLRYQFPYMEAAGKRPDAEPTLLATIEAAIDLAMKVGNGLPLFAGGKSMGGRMTSRLMAASSHVAVRGLVFFGFPLHPSKKPARTRAEHLMEVKVPMLFMQGTRDDLSDMTLMKAVAKDIGKLAQLHVVDGADHSFAVLKRSGRNEDDVRDELAETTRAFCAETLRGWG